MFDARAVRNTILPHPGTYLKFQPKGGSLIERRVLNQRGCVLSKCYSVLILL